MPSFYLYLESLQKEKKKNIIDIILSLIPSAKNQLFSSKLDSRRSLGKRQLSSFSEQTSIQVKKEISILLLMRPPPDYSPKT